MQVGEERMRRRMRDEVLWALETVAYLGGMAAGYALYHSIKWLVRLGWKPRLD